MATIAPGKRTRPVHPNAGIRAAYYRAMLRLIEDMHDSVMYWVERAFRTDTPVLTQEVMALDAVDPVKRTVADMLRDLHKRANETADEYLKSQGGRGHPYGTATTKLPSGVELFETRSMAQSNTYGVRRGAQMRSEFRIRRPGEKYSKRVSRESVITMLEAEARVARSATVETIATTPATALSDAVKTMAERWEKRFDSMAPRLAKYFATAVEDRSTRVMRDILREGGISVRFQMTPAQRDILDATIQENVSLIKSIPRRYLRNVESLVMQSVQTGRDLGTLSKALQAQFGVSKRRAALIARDQNNKATSALTRARQVELGLFHATWRHSGAGKQPRPKHVAANGKTYDVRKGLKIGDKGQWVLPGEEINCRCVSIPIVPTLMSSRR